MTAANVTAEELTNSIAHTIAERLKLEPDKVITKLVTTLTDKLLKSSSNFPVKQTIQKPPEDTKIPKASVVQKPLEAIKISQTPIVQKPLEDIKIPKTSAVQKPLEATKIPKTSVVQKPLEAIKISQTPIVQKPLEATKIPKTSVVQKPLEVINASKNFAQNLNEQKKEQERNFKLPQTKSNNNNYVEPKETKNPIDIRESQQSVFQKENAFKFDGFTEKGLTKLKEELPDIIKKGVSDLITKSTDSKKEDPSTPGGNLLKGLGILSGIAGLMTLLYGLSTDGPFKGLSKLVGTGLLSISGFTKMFDGVVKKMLRHLIKLPKIVLGHFSKAISGMLGSGAGSTLIKSGLAKLTNFLPEFLAGALKLLKKVPFFGSLISIGFAVSRFNAGDHVGGGIEVLSGIAALFPGIGTGISFALDALNAFLDFKAGGANKEASSKKMDFIGEFTNKIGSWLKEKLIRLPIVGPLIKSVNHFINKNWVEGIKQLAYANPIIGVPLEVIASMLGDESTSEVSQSIGAGVQTGWEWTKEIGSKIWQKLKNTPIIGPSIKGFQQIFQEGNLIDGLTTLAQGITDLSPLKWLIDWIAGPDTVNTSISNTASTIKNTFGFAKEIQDKLLRKVLEFIPESFMGISLRTRVAKWMGIDLGPINDESSSSAEFQNNSNLKTTPTPVADAMIDSSGGLVVSSPQEGSLFQLSKNDGIVAAPIDNQQTPANAELPGFKNDSSNNILEKIEKNTNDTNQSISNLAEGFISLAKALEKISAAVLEKPSPAPTIINQQSEGQNTIRSTQAAKTGNKNISNLRQTFELFRQRPA